MKWWSLLLLLGVAAFLPLSLWVVLLSNSPLVWCFFPLPLLFGGAVSLIPSLFGGAVPHPPLFGGAVSLIPSLFGGAVSHPLSSFLFLLALLHPFLLEGRFPVLPLDDGAVLSTFF